MLWFDIGKEVSDWIIRIYVDYDDFIILTINDVVFFYLLPVV